MAESLLLHTEERFVQNAREAESVGGLAWTILEGLGPQLPVNTLRALCQAFLGNCRRIAYDWHEARQRFERARFFLSRGNGDPLFSARIEELEAALLRDTGEYAEALELLASAAATYKAVGSHDSLGTILFRKAICLRMKGDRLEALDSMFSSLVYLDEEADAHLAVRARHELAVLLTDCGRHREAAAILHDGLDLEQRFGPDHVYVLHNAWAWGSTLFGLGRYDEARSRFEAAHRGFLKREDTDTASLLGLEMALFYLASGESSRAVQLARESCESLAGESLDTVSRRALASFMHLLTGRTLAIQEMYRQLRVVLERR